MKTTNKTLLVAMQGQPHYSDRMLDAAPTMTTEQWLQEYVSMSQQDKKEAKDDIYGRSSTVTSSTTCPRYELRFSLSSRDQCISTDAASYWLAQMEQELNKIPQNDYGKSCFLEALRECPIVAACPRRRLQFLRCEEFNPKLAAFRLVNYWTKKKELFGDKHAFVPLTIDGALERDHRELYSGFLRLLPGTDSAGRAVLYAEPARFGEVGFYSVDGTMRVLWYLVECALEMESVLVQGMVIIGGAKDAKPENSEPHAVRAKIFDLFRNCFPIRVRAVHACHTPTHLRWGQLTLDALTYLVGRQLRPRFVVHLGTTSSVLQELEMMGLSRDQVPTLLGGQCTLDEFLAWIAWRKAMKL